MLKIFVNFFEYQCFRSPITFPLAYKKRRNVFNMTLTYRLDSDIIWYYGTFIDIKSGKLVGPANDVKWREPDENYHGEFLAKTFNIKIVYRIKTETNRTF